MSAHCKWTAKLALLGVSTSRIDPDTAIATVVSLEVSLDLSYLPVCPLIGCVHCRNSSQCLLCAAELVLSEGQCVTRCPAGSLEVQLVSGPSRGRACVATTQLLPTASEEHQGEAEHERHRRAVCGGAVTVGPYSGFPYVFDTNSGVGTYNSNINCQWYFVAPTNSLAVFFITSFVTEPGYDFFTIFNSATASGATLLAATASTAGPTGSWTATSNVLTTTFYTDSSVVYAGVKGSAGYLCTAATATVTTSGSLISSSISVNNNLNYGLSRTCVWNVQAPTGNLIQAVFSGTFNIEACCDRVNFYNGIGTGTAVINTYTGLLGASLPASGGVAFQSSGNTATVSFVSDVSIVNTGFRATINFIRK